MTAPKSDGSRLAEIVAILRKHRPVHGITPAKALALLEDLGPTYVKFGQILSARADLIPHEYTKALETLRADVPPMPIEQVYAILSEEYGRPWDTVFTTFSPVPLGSASIAQTHAATLPDGRRCAVKVQRPGLYATMEQDIRLLKKGAELLRITPAGENVDFGDVLDHLWQAAREELDFTRERENLEEFKRLCTGLRYADCPAVLPELCTTHVLVMEYIGGYQVDDPALTDAGYDRKEIATKLVYHYIEQITQYRFFHADPHPGNIRVENGKLYWLDLGMMGRLTPREAALYTEIIRTISTHDAAALTDALLSISNQAGTVDRAAVTTSIGAFFTKYQSISMAQMNMGTLVEEFLAILRKHNLVLPTGLTMLGRSLMVIQGSLISLDPEVNVLDIVYHYMAQQTVSDLLSEESLKQALLTVASTLPQLLQLPKAALGFLDKASAGEITVHQKQSFSPAGFSALSLLFTRLILAVMLSAFVLSGTLALSLVQYPVFCGLPVPSVILFLLAVVTAAVLLKYMHKSP